MPTNEQSSVAGVPAVMGKNTANGGAGARVGVEGESDSGYGVYGHSKSGRGVVASSESDYGLRATSKTSAGLRASSEQGHGVEGWSTASEGVVGTSQTGNAVLGQAAGQGAGVVGTSVAGVGVWGEATGGAGIRGIGHGAQAGVVGVNDAPIPGGNGGWFESDQGEGVRGTSKNLEHGGVVGVNTAGGIGVFGTSDNNIGVFGTSITHEGVHADTQSTTTAAMAVYQKNPASETAALYVKHYGLRTAAVFEGNIVVTGDIVLSNADCAEDFGIAPGSKVEPGTVMVLDDESTLRESLRAYDKRVAGVISGAGSYKPGLILDKQPGQKDRQPIALMGKVFCKVDARFGNIEVGDLLTTSPTPGHAMRADDPLQAFGAVIGKALRPFASGQGLIPILVALQ